MNLQRLPKRMREPAHRALHAWAEHGLPRTVTCDSCVICLIGRWVYKGGPGGCCSFLVALQPALVHLPHILVSPLFGLQARHNHIAIVAPHLLTYPWHLHKDCILTAG